MQSPSPPTSTRPGSYAQASPDYAPGPPRKKMRKGTKSCLECRRRKIKCTFEPGRTAVCNECYSRGSACIDQEHGEVHPTAVAASSTAEQSYSLRERVTQLEGLVREVLNRLPESQPKKDVQNTQGEAQAAAEALKNLKSSVSAASMIESGLSLPGGRHEDAPVLSLFDNAVLSRKKESPIISAHQHNKSKRVLEELHRLLPSPQDLETMLNAASEWWGVWRQMFPIITDPRCGTFKESVSHSLRSDKPAEVAKIILCIAISMDQMPADFEKKLNLPCSSRDLMEHCVSNIDRLITHDDEYSTTLEGIECMVLEAKFHINLGRPRRAWILFRRAIGFAELIGLHRIGNHPIGDDPLLHRQQSIWTHLFQGDRYLSLILGLPYGVPERFCTIHIPNDTSTIRPGELYLLRLSGLIGKIVDRNQDPAHMSFATTLRIDAELDEMAHSLPPSWWQIDRDPLMPREEFYDKLMAQFFHHQLRTLIHLPFMLKSSSDKRYHYSHQAALESSRKLIRYFSLLREDAVVGPFSCKLLDFQAFTAAMLLLLNLMGYSQSAKSATGTSNDPTPTKESQEQDAQDWALIDETIICLQHASKEAGGIVAAQSAKALEILAAVREKGCTDCEQGSSCRIAIPYFGTISIGAGSKFQMPQPTVPTLTSRGLNNPQGQMPTPPSSTMTHSTSSLTGSSQTSPASDPPSTFYTGNMSSANEFGQNMMNSGADDRMVSFDSFMGLPQTDFIPVVSTAPSTQQYMSNGTPSGFDNAALNSAPSFTFGSGIMDLDQGWNWTGDGSLAAEWNMGLTAFPNL